MTLRALQTRYAGCHFRSRLEARWAVFFDILGVEWEYEPECFELAISAPPLRYLPDFYLPTTQTWVEVKGSVTQLASDADRYTAFLDGGLLDRNTAGSAHGLLLLGPIPRPDAPHPFHWIYQHHKGVVRSIAAFSPDGGLIVELDDDSPSSVVAATPYDLTPSQDGHWTYWGGPVWNAINGARRARFERGTARVGLRPVTASGLATK